jgi:hypothetical protein
MSVRNVLPRPFFNKVTVSAGSSGSFDWAKYQNPHISYKEFDDYYKFSNETEGNNLVNSSVHFSVSDYVISKKDRRNGLIKKFLEDNFNVYMVQITSRDTSDIIRDHDNFHIFYNTFLHMLGVKALTNDYYASYKKYIDIILQARDENRIVDRVFDINSLQKRMFSQHVPDETGVQVNSRYDHSVDFQYDSREEYLGYFIFIDMNPELIDELPDNSVNEVLTFVNRHELIDVKMDGEMVYDRLLDLRNTGAIEYGLSYGFNEYINSASALKDNIFYRLYDGVKDELKHKNIFDDIVISYNKDDSVNFLFGIDFMRLLESASKYYSMINRGQGVVGIMNLRDIVAKTKIQEMKIVRRRVEVVDSFNRLGSFKKDVRVYDKAGGLGIEELVVISGDDQSEEFVAYSDDNGSLKKIDLYNGDFENVVYFSGSDKRAKELTDGYYQYGVHLTFEDGIRRHMVNLYRQFVDDKRFFEGEYYNTIVNHGKYDAKTNSLKSGYRDYVLSEGYYDGNKPWDRSFSSLRDLVGIIYGHAQTTESTIFWDAINGMASYIHPDTCNIDSLGVYVKVLNDMEAIIADYLDTSPKYTAYNALSNISARPKLQSTSYWFENQIVDSNFVRKGLTYFDIEDLITDFEEYTPEIPVDDFVSANQNASESSKFVPNSLVFGEKVLGVGSIDSERSRAVFGAIVGSSVGNKVGGPSSKNFYDGGLSTISGDVNKVTEDVANQSAYNVGIASLSPFGITIDDSNNPVIPTSNNGLNVSPITSFDDYVVSDYGVDNSGSAGEDTIDNNRAVKDSVMEPKMEDHKSGMVMERVGNNNNVVSGMVDGIIFDPSIEIQGYDGSNDRSGGRFIFDLEEKQLAKDEELSFEVVYGADMQMFDGYETDSNGRSNVKVRKWRKINPVEMANLTNEITQPTLFRIYNNSEMLKNTGLSLPIYNDYFILRPKN